MLKANCNEKNTHAICKSGIEYAQPKIKKNKCYFSDVR